MIRVYDVMSYQEGYCVGAFSIDLLNGIYAAVDERLNDSIDVCNKVFVVEKNVVFEGPI